MTFDDKIKAQLENHSTPLPAGAWDRFALDLNHSESEAHVFDDAVKVILDSHQSRYQSKHWQILKSSLDKQSKRLFDIHLAKTMEAAFVLLIAFALWPGYKEVSELPVPDTTVPVNPSYQEHRLDIAQIPLIDQTTLPSQTKVAKGGGPASNANSAGLSRKKTINDGKSHTAWPLSSNAESASDHTDLIPLSDPEYSEKVVTVATADLSITSHNRLILQGIPAKSTQLLAEIPADWGANNQIQQPVEKLRQRVSMAVLGDIHYIMTPHDHLLSKRGYDQLASGYGATIGYTLEGRKWGLRTQLGYRHLYYLPKPYTEVYDGDMQRGYFTESIRNIELNMLSIGFQLSRTVTRLGSWHMYALAGGTCHFAFQANYDRKQQFLPGVDPLMPGEIPQPTHPSKISQKRFADGLFEGGTLEENYYLSLDVGLGIEKHLNGRISIFLEQTYQHNPFKKSLGPNQDRINSLSLLAGTRILL